MFRYWSERTEAGDAPTPREVSEACKTSIHAARAAVRRYQSGIVPKPAPPGLAPKTVRNVHAFLHRALVDAVAGKYLVDNPAAMFPISPAESLALRMFPKVFPNPMKTTPGVISGGRFYW
jgi:hypothetical protein